MHTEEDIYTKENILEELTTNLNNNGIAVLTASTIGQYLMIVDAVTTIWRDKLYYRQRDEELPFYTGELAPWFRGVASSEYRLQPSLIRFIEKAYNNNKLQGTHKEKFGHDYNSIRSILKIEEYLLQRFKTFGSPLFSNRLPESEIGWNFILRHHRAPSRLLDWTKGSLVALHFAIRKNFLSSISNEDTSCAEEQAAVWILEPRRLAELTTRTRRILGMNKQDDLDHIKMYMGEPRKETSSPKFYKIDDQKWIRKEKYFSNLYPLPIIPNLVSPRIGAHIGRFTLHSIEQAKLCHGGLEEFAKETAVSDKMCYLVQVKINLKNCKDIARSLRMTGISDINFSQDLDGLADELVLRVKLGNDHAPADLNQ